MTTDSSGALRLFYSYALQDELWRQRLETSLATLKRQGYIAGWHQQEISAGAEWERVISTHLNEAHIILLLISPDFIASDYCYSNQVLRAMERHEAGEARVLPMQDTQRANQKSPALQLWTVPYRRNPFFTGREDLLTRLHDRLTQTKAAALTQPQAISGLGGIGKTQAAVEYAYRYRDDYHFVLWMSAATRETLLADFVALADLLHLPERGEQDQNKVVAAVKHWFATHDDYLLILDNADDLAMAATFLPLTPHGHVLLTTRASVGGSIAHLLAVEQMDKEESVYLLLRRSRILAEDASLEQVSAKDQVEAGAIVKELGGLPLALDQAGAYLEEAGCSLASYPGLYRTHRKELLQRQSALPVDHPEPVAMTWALSFQKVEQANPAAADLLRLCSFLAADSIPEAILKVTYDTWAQCQRYLPHIEICASLIDHYHLAFAEAADLCHSAGFYLNDVGQYEQAESLYQRALRVDESVFGPDHPEVATDLLEGYARLLRRMKRLEEAAPLEAGAKVIRARHHP